jgi:hypothetical protein
VHAIDEANAVLREKGYAERDLAVHAGPRGKALLKGNKILSPFADTPETILRVARELVPPAEELGRHVAVADMSAADAAWFWANAAPHPVRSLERPLGLGRGDVDVPTTYVRCLADEMVTGPVRQLPVEWEVRSVRSGHWPMVTRPDDLSDVLREAAEGAALPQSMATMR